MTGRPRRRAAGKPRASFFSLTPDRVLDAVEVAGARSTGRCLPLRAFENRVYEVELEGGERLIAKFYRPGRWSRETILDEHAFLTELASAEIAAVAPLALGTSTLGEIDGILYAVFPRIRGRILDELDAEGRRRIGRTIGRMHAVGAARVAPHRPRLDVARYIHEPLEVLLAGRFIPEGWAPRYRDVALRIAAAVAAPLAAAPVQRIHGDLHPGNVLWGADGPILVDFDDFVMGPPVQDLWLLARGDSEEVRRWREDLLEGYEVFREFDRATLRLCEPLRALRIVYMSAWIARRWEDPAFPSAFPAFGTASYWADEYEVLTQIAEGLG
jgi:Ser/Thr protein kinase RdoA (MazF antagonist)